jgi:MarR family transcriptional regulator, lower aerobic nicotinate degradation pathway regulator
MGTHSNRSKPDRVTGILDSIRRIVRVLRVSSRTAEKQVGLSGAQLFVLQALKAKPSQSINELAERTRTHQSSVSVVVQKLVERGLVIRNPSPADARRLELTVAPAANALLSSAPDTVQNRLIAALEQLPLKDQTRLDALLCQVVADIGLDGGSTGESAPMFFEDENAVTRTQPQIAPKTGPKSNPRSEPKTGPRKAKKNVRG